MDKKWFTFCYTTDKEAEWLAEWANNNGLKPGEFHVVSAIPTMNRSGWVSIQVIYYATNRLPEF